MAGGPSIQSVTCVDRSSPLGHIHEGPRVGIPVESRASRREPNRGRLPIRAIAAFPKPKPLSGLCGIGCGSVPLPSWPRIPAPHNIERHRKNRSRTVHGSGQPGAADSPPFFTGQHAQEDRLQLGVNP
jgi:hypothetical protein